MGASPTAVLGDPRPFVTKVSEMWRQVRSYTRPMGSRTQKTSHGHSFERAQGFSRAIVPKPDRPIGSSGKVSKSTHPRAGPQSHHIRTTAQGGLGICFSEAIPPVIMMFLNIHQALAHTWLPLKVFFFNLSNFSANAMPHGFLHSTYCDVM